MKRSRQTPWQIRLISEKGESLGIMPLLKAHELAKQMGREIIDIGPTGKPPIWRILPDRKRVDP